MLQPQTFCVKLTKRTYYCKVKGTLVFNILFHAYVFGPSQYISYTAFQYVSTNFAHIG